MKVGMVVFSVAVTLLGQELPQGKIIGTYSAKVPKKSPGELMRHDGNVKVSIDLGDNWGKLKPGEEILFAVIEYPSVKVGKELFSSIALKGYRPATREELALFASRHVNECKDGHIYALAGVEAQNKKSAEVPALAWRDINTIGFVLNPVPLLKIKPVKDNPKEALKHTVTQPYLRARAELAHMFWPNEQDTYGTYRYRALGVKIAPVRKP